ncbi:MAG: hypothetical protein MK212_20665 [Saprospiraceae bacterium]|nr:hypothetical protein [Saprospiraceae bacterium]
MARTRGQFKTSKFSHTALVMYLKDGTKTLPFYSKDNSPNDLTKGIEGLEKRILRPRIHEVVWGYIIEVDTGTILHYYHESRPYRRLDHACYKQCLADNDLKYNCTLYPNQLMRERGRIKGKHYFNLTLQEIKQLFKKHAKFIAEIKIWSRWEKGVQLGSINWKGALEFF